MSSVCNKSILQFESVDFSYRRNESLIREMSLSVNNRDFIGLLGANGSGKSTILKLASGILTASEGEIKLWGKSIKWYDNKDRAKLLSYLPQILDINVPFTVREVVSMGIYPYDIPPQLTTDDAIKMVGLADKANSLITHLSGGERRRVYIAMTLLQGAGLVLMDEPLANLDIRFQIELMKLLRSLQEQRDITVIIALHEINIAFQFDKVMLVKDGIILEIGKPHEILTKDRIKEAFDVDVEVMKENTGGVYIKY